MRLPCDEASPELTAQGQCCMLRGMLSPYRSLVLAALLSCGLLLLSACRTLPLPADLPAAAPGVTRAQAVASARAYTTLRWQAESRHACHGADPDGQRVDTPDADAAPQLGKGFWWKTQAENIGMPYQWGGFDTPRSFVRRLREDPVVYAGDYASAAKSSGGDAAVSRYAAGIDCSGFVSRCWRLQRPYSTRELAALCKELPSEQELRPGDIMLCPGVHVMLFLQWADAEHTRFRAAEAGGGLQWNCYEVNYDTAWLREQGYRPYRYMGMQGE